MSSNEMKVYSVKEVADILQTSHKQVRKMIQNGELVALKVGREWRITVTNLTSFLEEN